MCMRRFFCFVVVVVIIVVRVHIVIGWRTASSKMCSIAVHELFSLRCVRRYILFINLLFIVVVFTVVICNYIHTIATQTQTAHGQQNTDHDNSNEQRVMAVCPCPTCAPVGSAMFAVPAVCLVTPLIRSYLGAC